MRTRSLARAYLFESQRVWSRRMMGDAYAPSLTVTRNALVRKQRRLPLEGTVVVEVGAHVKAADVIARAELPGQVTLTNVASKLGVLADEVERTLLVRVGAAVK